MLTAKHRINGQALVLVTFALIAMIGIVGMAVDFSFAYFLEKTMQAAADSAALAAVQKAKETGGTTGINCSNANCYPSATLCSAIGAGTARAGCQYAAQNGFAAAEVSIEANAATAMVADGACTPAVKHPPTAGCVSTLYYATVRISRRVPQLFSAILGRSEGGVSARATAAISEVTLPGALIVINRNNDLAGIPNCPNCPRNGTNVDVQGGGTINVPGGIILGSSAHTGSDRAGRIQSNSGSVVSPFTYGRDPGPGYTAADLIGGNASQNWTCTTGGSFCAPTIQGDGDIFYDPFDIKSRNGDISGQPPIYGPSDPPPNPLTDLRPVPQGILTTTAGGICPNGVCPPGIYYATEPDCNGCTLSHPSGRQLRTDNNSTVTFAGGSPFERFIYVGGLSLQNGTIATFGPGRHVFAGVLNAADPVFQSPNGVTITGGNGSDAGRIMIYTDFRTGLQRDSTPGAAQSYANQIEQIQTAIRDGCLGCNWTLNPWANTGMRHGVVDLQSGNNSSSQVRLDGLNPTNAAVPAELVPYGKVLMWQDQHNSYVKYTNQAQVDLSCGGQNSPCAVVPDSADAPMLSLWASPFTDYKGVIYQPRGAWTKMQGSGAYQGPLQIVSGAMMLAGTPDLTLTGNPDPISTFKTALVE